MPVESKQVIAGLYAAFFNRAPDAEGLAYWVGRAANGSDFETFNEIAAGFAGHPKFGSIYDTMTNQQFVESIYVNTLGSSGDSGGIAYWLGELDGGMARSEMVASFVYEALNFDVTDSRWDSLSADDKTNASSRKEAIANKADLGNYFVDNFGDNTNIVNNDDLNNDAAYLASIRVLQGIDSSSTSVAANKSIDGTELFGDSYVDSRVFFSTEELDGTTLYLVWDEDQDGEIDGYLTEVAGVAFDTGSFTLIEPEESYIGDYSVSDGGIVQFSFDADGDGKTGGEQDVTVYLKGFTQVAEINALKASWSDNPVDLEEQTLHQATEDGDFLYVFYDAQSKDSFVELQMVGLSETLSLV